MNPCKIWIEQCEAAKGIEVEFGTDKALDYLIAQVLEYWLDVSRFSRWKRPAVKLPWNRDVFNADVETCRKRGIRHVTTFAVWVDAEYKNRFGDFGFNAEYDAGIKSR